MRQAGGRALGLLQSPVSWRAFVHRRPEPTYTTEWLARKHRANFARRRRELGRRLGAELRVVDRAASDPHAAIEEFLQLEASGWKGRSGTALLRRPGHARFFRETCRAFASQGRLMLLSLQAGSRVVAQSTALVGGDGLFGFKKTYDERLARWSPGTLLDLEVLAWFHQRTDLAWLDTCSSVDNQGASQVFRDRRPIGAMLLPTSRLGSAAATLLPVAFRAHAYLRATRAGRATPRQRQLDQRP
jgi:hypothetical protein